MGTLLVPGFVSRSRRHSRGAVPSGLSAEHLYVKYSADLFSQHAKYTPENPVTDLVLELWWEVLSILVYFGTTTSILLHVKECLGSKDGYKETLILPCKLA